METFIYYVEKIYNTIKANGIYIFLSVFFVFLLFVVSDVSNDFIYALSDAGNLPNVFYIVLAFILLTISLWVIPGAFLKTFLGSKTEPKVVEFYYRGFEKIYNGRRNKKRNQVPVKYIAIAPWIIYNTTLVVCLAKSLVELIKKEERKEWMDKDLTYIALFVLILFLSFTVLAVLNQKSSKLYRLFIANRNHKKVLNAFLMFFVIFLVFPLIVFIFKDVQLELSTEISYCYFLIALIIYNFLCILMTFLFLIYKEKERADTKSRYEFSRKIHRAVLILSGLFLLIFCVLSLYSKLIWISPTVILIIVSAVLVLVFELLYTTPRIIITISYSRKKPTAKYDWQEYIFFGSLVLLALYFLLLQDKKIYMIKRSNQDVSQFEKKADTLIDKRDTLEDRFYEWLCHNHHIDDPNNNEPIDVFLISGQGGGSTAGTWLLSGLLNADATNPQFYKNIFSISTVSGSSNGANFYLAIKTNNVLSEDIDASFMKEERDNIVRKIYNRNYFSSNFLGLMFSDFTINPLISISSKKVDRNYILQKEEANAMVEAAELVHAKNLDSVRSYFDQDYFNLWYPKKNMSSSKPLNPLLFLNTTLMNTGEKAIFSPVKFCNQGIRAKDIAEEFAKTKEGNSSYIPISAAVAQSQAFPILSTYNLVPGIGNLGDGGFYENTGTSTTLAVYKKLKRYYKKDLADLYPNRQIRFILMCFISEDEGELKKKKNIEPAKENTFNILGKSMIYYTISQTYKTPFKGHAEDALKALEEEVNMSKQEEGSIDEYLPLKNSEKFATTRLISTKTINEMLQYGRKDKGAGVIIGNLKRIEASRNDYFAKNKEASDSRRIAQAKNNNILTSNILAQQKNITRELDENAVRYNRFLDSISTAVHKNISVNTDKKVSTVYLNYTKNVDEKFVNDISNYIRNKVSATVSEGRKNNTYVFTVPGYQKVSFSGENTIRYFNIGDKDLAESLQKELSKKGVYFGVKPAGSEKISTVAPKGRLDILINDLKNYEKR